MSKFDDRVTFTINTKDRKEYLLITLTSLLSQTFQNFDLIIMDCSAEPCINDERVARLLQIFKKYGIGVRYEAEAGIGIPWSYEKMRKMANTDLIVRQEDDVYFEPESLQRLVDVFNGDVIVPGCDTEEAFDRIGALGFMTPNYKNSGAVPAPKEFNNAFYKVHSAPTAPSLPYIYEPRDQQEAIIHEDRVYPVCHIHGGALYRNEAAQDVGGFCTNLSPTGHREETLFYSRMYVKGWNLYVRTSARLWHFESTLGGSRPAGVHDPNRLKARLGDESLFQAEIKRYIENGDPSRPFKLFDV